MSSIPFLGQHLGALSLQYSMSFWFFEFSSYFHGLIWSQSLLFGLQRSLESQASFRLKGFSPLTEELLIEHKLLIFL